MILPLRPEWPDIAEEVHVIGTPLHYSKLENTVTKGIVSNHRRDYKYRGLRLNFIQSDVSIHGGNSGGPLLDEYGNIIGLSVLGYDDPGLNLFIPIKEALEVLDIKI